MTATNETLGDRVRGLLQALDRIDDELSMPPARLIARAAKEEARGLASEVDALVDRLSPPPSRAGEENFVAAFNALAADVLANSKAHGFEDQPNAVSIALMHSELSEALEADRHGNPPDDKVPEFTGVEAELADVVIRIMNKAAAREYRVAEAIVAKMAANAKREYRHGGKAY